MDEPVEQAAEQPEIKRCTGCKAEHFVTDFPVDRLNRPTKTCFKCKERRDANRKQLKNVNMEKKNHAVLIVTGLASVSMGNVKNNVKNVYRAVVGLPSVNMGKIRHTAKNAVGLRSANMGSKKHAVKNVTQQATCAPSSLTAFAKPLNLKSLSVLLSTLVVLLMTLKST